jgi:hypothetical protein
MIRVFKNRRRGSPVHRTGELSVPTFFVGRLTQYDGLVPLKERDWFQPPIHKMENSDHVYDQSFNKLAERERFELSVQVDPVRRFSKPLVSATHPPLQGRCVTQILV